MKSSPAAMALLIFMTGFILGSINSGPSFEEESPKIEVVSIYDGDTFIANIKNWPKIIGHRISIRINGIDAPEMHDKDKAVHELAVQAKMFVVEKLRNAKKVEIKNLERDKFFRIDADIYVDGQLLSDMLLKEKLAVPYHGGHKLDWDKKEHDAGIHQETHGKD